MTYIHFKIIILILFNIYLCGQDWERGEIILTNYKPKKIGEVYVIKDNVVIYSFARRVFRMGVYDFKGRLLYYIKKKIDAKKNFMPLNFFYAYGKLNRTLWFLGKNLLMINLEIKDLKVFDVPEHSYLVRALNPFINDSLLILLKYYKGMERGENLTGKKVFVVWNLHEKKQEAELGVYPEALRKIDYSFVGGVACYVDSILNKVYVQYLIYPYLDSYVLSSFEVSGGKVLIPDYNYFFIGADNKGFYFRRKITGEDYSYEVVKISKGSGDILSRWLIPNFDSQGGAIIRFFSDNSRSYLQAYYVQSKTKEKVRIEYYRFYLE